MNLIDNRTKQEKLYQQLIDQFDKVVDAKKEIDLAKLEMEKIWSEFLDDRRQYKSLYALDNERVIVKDGSFIYEIEFDLEEYCAPKIRRIDSHTAFHNVKR